MSGKKTSEYWDRKFLGLALYYATLSKDPSTQVGCVLVDDDKIPVGFGVNGLSRHADDRPEHFERPEKYRRVIHAEVNAIYNSNASTRGTTAYLTHPPCITCCQHVSQNNIKKVVFIMPTDEGFKSRYNVDEILQELQDLRIEVQIYDLTHEDLKEIFNVSL